MYKVCQYYSYYYNVDKVHEVQYLCNFFQTFQHEIIVPESGQLRFWNKQTNTDVQGQLLFHRKLLSVDQGPVI